MILPNACQLAVLRLRGSTEFEEHSASGVHNIRVMICVPEGNMQLQSGEIGSLSSGEVGHFELSRIDGYDLACIESSLSKKIERPPERSFRPMVGRRKACESG